MNIKREAGKVALNTAGIDGDPSVDGLGQPTEPGYLSNLATVGVENIPSLRQSATISTIAGWRTNMRGDLGKENTMIRNNLGRLTRGRYANVDVFAPDDSFGPKVKLGEVIKGNAKPGEYFESRRGKHTLFSASGLFDHVGRNMSKVGGTIGAKASAGGSIGLYGRLSEALVDRGILPSSPENYRSGSLLTKGTMGHLSTSASLIGKGEVGVGGTTASNLRRTMEALSRGKHSNPRPVSIPNIHGGMSSRTAGYRFAASSSTGAITGTLQGAMVGADAYMTGNVAYRATGTSAGAQAFNIASQWAGRGLAEAGIEQGAGKVGMQGVKKIWQSSMKKYTAEAVGKQTMRTAAGVAAKSAARTGAIAAAATSTAWVPIVNFGMAAWLAYDVAKLGVTLAKEAIIKPIANFARDGYRSYKGNIEKSPMGMGFEDNTVAATSRQRGVMAISNSRLNARSALGNEAAAMSAHFGGTTW